MYIKNRFSLALSAPLMFAFLISLVYSEFALARENSLKQADGGKGLEKVRRSKFSDTYVKPEVDFSFYNTVYIGEALFDYRDVKPSKMSSGIYSNTTSNLEYPINEEDRRQFEKIVREAFRTEIVKGKHFKIVDVLNTDEHTLIMRGVVMDIVSKVPPESVGRTRLYMSSVGGATLGLEFLDGTTGEVLARVAERGRIGDATGQVSRTSQPVNRTTVIADVKRWATNAAIKLRKVLDSALEG